jgi:2-desacetyl-2-hydroxyethyl bacteriochlorophyllide A dehydrogenase
VSSEERYRVRGATRRALVISRPGEMTLVEKPTLEAEPGNVVVRPVHCGVCGTDLELLRGDVDPAYVDYPLTLGHEWVGVVEAVGEEVGGVEPGDHCVAEGIVPCGRCASCLRGATNTCEVYDEIGFTREGGASDQIVVPARLVHRLSPDVSLLDAALVEPTAVVLRALEKASPPEGARVVIVGDGTIALLAAHLIRLWTPGEVVVVGRRAEQHDLALELGATRFTTDDGEAVDADLAIEAAGAVDAVATAIRAAKRGATVSLIGLPPTGRALELPADLLVNNDLTIAASFSYTTGAWKRVVALLHEERIAPGALVTHRFPLERYEEAFAALGAPAGTRGKVLLDI